MFAQVWLVERNREEAIVRDITPFLWFDAEAEAAAELYVSLVPNSRILKVTRYGSAGHGEPGTVMTVSFELDGRRFTALNGGPMYRLNEAFSLCVLCETQDEVDELWAKLSDGGEEGRCGWLKDRYGLSWQVVPTVLEALLGDPDPERSERVMAAMLPMGKLDIHVLERAHAGRRD
jgi:predicted 3-demethylubiquinone-9 3-methyltransferase (glyoxalase superfamily)